MHSLQKLTIICIGALLFSAACSNEKKLTINSGGMTHTFAEGKESMPKDFPLPLYPGATPTGSVSAEGDSEEQSKYVILKTTDTSDKVNDFYQDELKKAGWSIDNIQNMPKLISISGNKGGLDANVMIADDGGQTTISLQINKAVETKKEDEEPSENYTPDKVIPPTD